MAEGQWGGRRTPRNPAPTSGPGQLSQRTDGGPQQVLSDVSGMAYGENQAMESLQSAAPMSASGQSSARASRNAPRSRGGQQGGSKPTPLMSPTSRPGEPVTDGATFGPGSGPRSLPNAREQSKQDAQMIAKYLPDLMDIAESQDTPEGFKRFVRYLRDVSR